MSDADRLTPAIAEYVAEALAFAQRYSGRKCVHDAAEMMAAIVAKRLVEHLERSGFVVMKNNGSAGRPPSAKVTNGPDAPGRNRNLAPSRRF